ncbi:unnamed protein product [Microthlaspi erraticum]|uniref:Uncharacterized protein n=1 Tax=Microthlaspi erraticum TaxID=1685480 RepID=A0A6D2KCD0_9BRAS|nr:unnamed protein product [Microthlaspi erraticum]
MRSSARPERLLGGAIQADAAERHRKTAVDEATATAEAKKVVEMAEMEEAARVAAEAERREETERQREGEEHDSGDETDSDEDEGAGPSSQARLEGIPDVIKMPSRTPPTGLTTMGGRG